MPAYALASLGLAFHLPDRLTAGQVDAYERENIRLLEAHQGTPGGMRRALMACQSAAAAGWFSEWTPPADFAVLDAQAVAWIAEAVAALYLAAREVPKA